MIERAFIEQGISLLGKGWRKNASQTAFLEKSLGKKGTSCNGKKEEKK